MDTLLELNLKENNNNQHLTKCLNLFLLKTGQKIIKMVIINMCVDVVIVKAIFMDIKAELCV